MNNTGKLIRLFRALLAVFFCMFLYSLAGRKVFGMITDPYAGYFAAQAFFAAVVMIMIVLLGKTSILHAEPEHLRRGWTSAGFAIVLIIFIFISGFAKLLSADVTILQAVFFLGHVLLIGFCEEVLFRGIVQNALHRWFGEDTPEHVLRAVVISGLIFGLAHLSNAMNPRISWLAAFKQALVTAFAGMYYGAIYFRTGKNIGFIILLHALYDAAGMISGGWLSGEGLSAILNRAQDVPAAGVLLWVVLYSAAILIVLRPKKVMPLLKQKRSGLAWQDV